MRRLGFLFLLLATVCHVQAQDRIDLSGTWLFALDEQGLLTPQQQFTDSVQLPGTTDTNRRGHPAVRRDETTHLTRLYSYKGRAWYQRTVTIPKSWKHRPVTLFLERTKPTQVYVDGHYCGSSNDISTPQVYDLTRWMKPGPHQLTILVDNGTGVPEQLYASSHAYTEDTQTNWNGIIGQLALCSSPAVLYAAALPQPSPFRDFHIEGQHFYADGHRLFLRGRHDACVWPLTGHVAMDLDSWRSYMQVCQDYGLNHVRFHSWCPPEAAFVAADEAGIILQPKLPFWGDFNDKDTVLMNFLHKEGENILRWYGHHPSFRMFALGNELWGSIEKMAAFIADFRRIAPDKLYTFGSNYYLGYQGVKPGMDYFTTCRVGGEAWGSYNTHTRSSFSFADAADGGMINHFRPNSTMNFEAGCALAVNPDNHQGVPVISHESAQFQTYPDYDEIKKYTGVLYPYNMEVFRDRLEKAGMADQVADFHRASGLWSLQLYKQDIEMDLRTPNMAGFQLLDLQDYPGQGSAYVGLLDAFLDSKHLCTVREWRQWCSDVVPLLVSPAYCFTNAEGIHAKIQVANYGGQSLKGKTLTWTLGSQSGTMALPDGEGLLDVGPLDIDLSACQQAVQLQLLLNIDDTNYHNTYDLWCYPAANPVNQLKQGILIAREITDEIGKKLEQGADVLLMPDSSAQCVGGLFQTDYWNYRMFKTISENNKKEVSPGTLGILCHPDHPLFALFPTEEHTNWQWFPVIKASHPFMLDNTARHYRPIVQVIDNIERNHKLGLVFEFRVGSGRLLVVMANLEEAAEYPEGRQFYASVLHYMHSAAFAPTTKISIADFHRLMTTEVTEGKIGELNNISPY